MGDATVLVGALLDQNLDHYGRKKRDAGPLSALDILTMDHLIQAQALKDLDLCWYSETKSFMLDSASVNSISSIPSPVYQWRKAFLLNMAVNCSLTRLKSSCPC